MFPSDQLQTVFDYHERTKHHFHRYARSLGYMDWDNQPNPFRRFDRAELIELDECPVCADATDRAAGQHALPYTALFDQSAAIAPHPLNRTMLSQLLFDSLALSAWKAAPQAQWSLRVNPSSGNLHPTDGYVLCPAVDELLAYPAVCHYAPFEHGLEIRRQLSAADWAAITADLPTGLLVSLTSTHWRESWKYGERAFRY